MVRTVVGVNERLETGVARGGRALCWGAGALLLLLTAGCPDHTIAVGDGGPTGDAMPTDGEASSDASGGDGPSPDGSVTVLGPEGARAEVPAGALPSGVPLTITTATAGYPPFPQAWQPLGDVFAFTPHGQGFAQDIVITVPFAPADAAAPELFTAEPGGTWAPVPGARASGGVMTASVNHVSFFVVASSPPPQWQDVSGTVPHDGSAAFIVQAGGQVFVRAFTGVYEAPSLGSPAWAPYMAGFPAGIEVRYLATDGTVLYAATSAGVFASVPSVSSWSSISAGLPAGISTVATNHGVLYAGTEVEGVRMFASTNGGASWAPEESGLQENASFATFDTWVVNGVVLTAGGGGLYYTNDDGASWHLAGYTQGSAVRSVSFCSGRWYLGAEGLFSAPTLAGRFVQSNVVPGITGAGPYGFVSATLCVGSRLYLGSDSSGVAYTDDAGGSFTTYRAGFARSGNGSYPSVYSLAYANGLLLAGASEPWLKGEASYLYAAPAPGATPGGGPADPDGGGAPAADAPAPFVSGWDPRIGSSSLDDHAGALLVDGSGVLVGGSFLHAGGRPANLLASFDPAAGTFTPLANTLSGSQPSVNAIARSQGALFVGGAFAGGLARQTADGFAVTGGGLTSPGFVFGLSPDTAALWVGGSFVTSDHAASNVASWNGTGWGALTADPDAAVLAVSRDAASLWVGGDFITSVGVPAMGLYGIGRYDLGSNTWVAIGSGATEGHEANGRATVSAIVPTPDFVYVGGDFAKMNGQAIGNLARWRRASSTWEALPGGGVVGAVADLAYDGGKLYVAGLFNQAGGIAAGNVAIFDPATATWSTLPDGGIDGVFKAYPPQVLAIAAAGKDVFLAGDFATGGGVPSAGFAHYRFP